MQHQPLSPTPGLQSINPEADAHTDPQPKRRVRFFMTSVPGTPEARPANAGVSHIAHAERLGATAAYRRVGGAVATV